MRISRFGIPLLQMIAVMAFVFGPTQFAAAQFKKLDEDIFGKSPQTPRGEEIRYETKFVPAQAHPGEEVTLQITATVAEGWHTFSLTQPLLGGSPTIVRVLKSPGLKALGKGFAADREPDVRKEKIGEANFVFEEYEGRVTFSRRFRVNANVEPGEAVLFGTVHYQVCKRVCINDTHDFTAVLNVLPGNAAQPTPSPAAPEVTEFKNSAATWKVSIQPSKVQPGGTATLSVVLDLEKPWHTYGMDQQKLPDGDGPGFATAIEVTEHGDLIVPADSLTGTAPHVDEDPELFPGLKILTHDGHVVWTQQVKVPADAKAGEVPISGRIGYMICTDKKCEQPTGLTFQGKLTVAEKTLPDSAAFSLAGPLEPKEVMPFVESFAAARAAAVEDVVAVEKPHQDRALIPFIILAMTAGFASLLTPCVFPMIPITVSFFLKQSEKAHHRPVITATIYCVGIIATFTILGLLMAAIFGATSLNQLMNNPGSISGLPEFWCFLAPIYWVCSRSVFPLGC